MNKDFPVRGLADLDRYLAEFPKQMQKAALRQALTAAAKPIRDEARLRAPSKTGKLARAIKTGSPRQNEDGSFSISIRLTGPDAYLGHFIEYGVSPHLIARKGARRGRAGLAAAKSQGEKVGGVVKIGDEFVSGIISHPGFAARPFMRPALDLKAEEAVQAFGDRIRSFIEDKTGFAAPVDEAA
jgi:HK97 gp10 family phage protein